jgi:pyruvate formate lyase activating enzyme
MRSESIKVYDLTPFTLLDFPDTPSAILWLAGCNMRCPYCHNPEIVFGKNGLDFVKVEEFLKKRRKVLEGVVISGGEPTLHPRLFEICERIKELGYKIKLDTNGSNPKIVEKLIKRGLLDFVALDLKAPEYKYEEVTKSNFFKENLKTLLLLNSSPISFEVRTTVHPELLEEKDVEALMYVLKEIGSTNSYILQNFKEPSSSIGNMKKAMRSFDIEKLPPYINIITRNF